MTSLEELGAYVSHGIRGSVSESLRSALALHVIDTVTAWIATAGTQEARALRKFRDDIGATSLDPALDILINCAITRVSETDDIHLAAMITPGAIIIPGALTIAAALPPNPDALNEAILAGYEAMIRLGLALDGPTILYRGIWPSYIAAPFGIAAAAARLLDLSGAEAAHALAQALTLAAPGVGHHNAPTGTRWFAIGNAARYGLLAAQAARSGLTSDLNLLDDGFFSTVFGITPKAGEVTQQLGAVLKLAEVSFKPWCAARQTMAATHALREIMDAGFTASDITAVEVSVPPPFLKMIDHGIVGGRTARLTSQPYQIAIAALAPDLAFDVAQTDTVPTDVLRFMNKIGVRADENLLDGFPRRWPARVRARTSQSEHERLVVHIPGDPERPFGVHDVTSKSRRLAGVAADDIVEQCVAMFETRTTPAQLIAWIDQTCAHIGRVSLDENRGGLNTARR
jgi:2-methylcitrate dehydratase PrpD